MGVGLEGTDPVGIKSTGAWYFLGYKPLECDWCFNVGASVEGMTSHMASYATAALGADARQRNWQAFGNAIYNITPNSQWGVELSRWTTKYYSTETGEAWRVQTSFIFKF